MTAAGTMNIHNRGQSLRGIISLSRLLDESGEQSTPIWGTWGQSECQPGEWCKCFFTNEIRQLDLMRVVNVCKDLQLESSFQQPVPNRECSANCGMACPCEALPWAPILMANGGGRCSRHLPDTHCWHSPRNRRE